MTESIRGSGGDSSGECIAANERVRELREAALSEIDFGNFTDAAILNTEADRIEAVTAALTPETMPLLMIHGAAMHAMADGKPEEAAHITAILAKRLRDEDVLGGVPFTEDDFVRTLALHALVEIRCDHEAKTDTPACNCAVVALGSHPTVQAAKEAWAAHVWEVLHAY